MPRPPLPPLTLDTAMQKVRLAEDAWNDRDPARVALAHEPDSRWRNRSTFLQGRVAIWAFVSEGLMHTRIASINDVAIAESERLYHWPAGRRPDGHVGLTELGL